MSRLLQRRAYRLWILSFVLTCYSEAAVSHAEKPKGTVITIHAKRYAFVPAEITVHVGKPTRLIFVSDDVPHGIAVPGLSIDLPINKKPASLVVTPESIAEFTGRCTRYCGSGHDEMKLTIHVIK